ncbi:glycosyltransferase family 2 protein [Paraburkholderia unamae]|uniref:glycosyltransferase family 2 protein n=1 Tax=Paraburkholderia unamae TaxID=219649 RepID=UPI000DD427FF|nr:glycosyltransferase family 2 protein [Paraburkholderia unamae]
MPPISIIIPCFNAASTLPRTLESCMIQPEAAEIIVVDDASTDESAEVVRRYTQRDARIALLHMPVNGGSARARNWAALHTSQPVLAFVDADDEYFPGALGAANQFLNQNPDAASVRLDVEYAGFPEEIVKHPDFEKYAATLSNTIPSSLVIRRAVYLAMAGFPMDEFFRQHGGEDGALSWALSRIFGNPRLIDTKRVRMHHHARSHATHFFRVSMGMHTPDPRHVLESIRLSSQFVAATESAIRQMTEMSRLATGNAKS